MIAVIDYGMGNLHSVAKALEHVAAGVPVQVTSDPSVIAAAERVVFPGQGAARDCMREIDAHGLRAAISAAMQTKPFLGICMGLQVLFERSAEGDTPCLGLLSGEVKHFANNLRDAAGERLKVPHMGWNRVRQTQTHPLWAGIADCERFYFVHSYFVVPQDASIVCGVSDYPTDFVSAVGRDNVFAVQFHPEKSAAVGLHLLKNFVTWQP